MHQITSDVRRVMDDTGMGEIQARRHVEQRRQLAEQYAANLRRTAKECVAAYAARSAGSIADVIELEHAAADDAHVTGLPLVHCQQYVRRNAALVDALHVAEYRGLA